METVTEITSISESSKRTDNAILSNEVQNYVEHKTVALSNLNSLWHKLFNCIFTRVCLPCDIRELLRRLRSSSKNATYTYRTCERCGLDLSSSCGCIWIPGSQSVHWIYKKRTGSSPSLGSSLTAIGAICRPSSIIPTHHSLQQWFLPRNKPCLLPHPSNWFNRWQEEQFIYGNYICVLGL